MSLTPVGSLRKEEKAVLRGYVIDFNKKAFGKKGVGYTNIIEKEGSTVEGVLYHLTCEMTHLDVCEGYPNHYNKIYVDVELENGEIIKSITYIAIEISENVNPEKYYLAHLIKGAIEFGLSDTYIEMAMQKELGFWQSH